MKFIIIHTLIAGIVLAFQASTSVYPDLGYILGLAVMLITVLGGFAKLVSQNTKLQSTVDEQAKAMNRQDKKIEEICHDMREMSKQINQIEKDIVYIKK